MEEVKSGASFKWVFFDPQGGRKICWIKGPSGQATIKILVDAGGISPLKSGQTQVRVVKIELEWDWAGDSYMTKVIGTNIN